MIGFPSVGKSTLLNKVTNTTSAVAATEFTTLTAIPGVMEIEGAKVQLLDLPGIVEGAAQGRGRGRQVVAVAHTADLIMMILDITKPDSQRELLTQELEAVGVRLNQTKPDVTIKPKTAGGVTITVTAPLTKIDEKMIKQILQSYRMHNADVMIREDINVDQFIDCVLNNRSYIKFSRLPHSFVVSCEAGYNMDRLNQKIWTALDLNRVYTKKRGERPDLEQPLIIRQGGTVEHVIHSIHRGLVEKFKYALVWGKSSKFNPQPQRVGLHHVLSPDDVITIFTK
ncbi:P-loop containing nucleoside triphosphate hydrolase protein [Phakopsora pachyrhizi]|nr:P-loop containing nucleoside triphosphate hydrolase protein [Phakopsora pachyrhizi]